VFATRSPHRPNPIGISCVELLEIQKNILYVGKNDLLDGTPILDIKPYLTYADAFPDAKEGWTQNATPTREYVLEWSEKAQRQLEWIQKRVDWDLAGTIELRLSQNPYPFPNHRIKQLSENGYELAVKSWRVRYQLIKETVFIEEMVSGYDQETLEGTKNSRWMDVPLHREFLNV
jgi:hypothetical protein